MDINMHSLRHVAVLFLLTPLLLACQPQQSVEPLAMTPEFENDLAALHNSRIFFGHQSVGGNIMEGLADLQKDSKHPLAIINYGDPIDRPGGYILHTAVGKNEQPDSKCDDFRRIIDQELGDNLDIALLKFCYIDINGDTDVNKMFEYYQTTLDGLKHRHPGITFVHVTAPLRHSPGGFGVWIREVLGRPNHSKLANIKRHEFNELMLNTYKGDPIFDLAASQSTYPDGSRESFEMNGKTYYGLIGAYTYDGGHLNATGRSHVAAAMIKRLAQVTRAK